MRDDDLDAPDLFINRELSWLEFNDRVLGQGLSGDVPPMERLKFLSIVSTNLDEFFMIRVAGLKQQLAGGVTARDISGLTPAEQLRRISRRAHRMVVEQADAIREVCAVLARHGLHLRELHELTNEQQEYARSYFASTILPVLSPLAVEQLSPFPVLPGLTLNLAVALRPTDAGDGELSIAVIPVPGNLPRFLTLPTEEELHLVPVEAVMGRNIAQLFPEYRVEAVAVFRLTRDGDVAIDDDVAGDLLASVEDAVRERRRRAVVRLELSADPHPALREWLVQWCELEEQDVYEVDGLLDAGPLMDIATRPGFGELKVPDWPPQSPADIHPDEALWETLQKRNLLLFHPYESFQPVVRLLEEAAEDPNVLAIKQTLYRTSGGSPVVKALARAAENGKQVVVLVELKARFDEARNVNWARRLEDAGCQVIYGIAGLKTHAKMLLIIRREAHGVRRYVHMSTGNYNARTARLYSDIGLMTSERDMARDASAFFNLLTGYSQEVGWAKLVMAPTGLRQRFIEMIKREIDASSLDHPGLIMAKMNSLQDKEIIKALYRASRAGVRVRLNVRGICCLRPGIEGVSHNIEVVSIVDRYLEHARVYYFRNGGHEEVYLASADWMERNLDRRLEVLFPVDHAALRRRLIGILDTFFADNAKARRLLPDGEYEPVNEGDEPLRAQQEFYRRAVEAAHARAHEEVRFQPLTSPEGGSG
ncbi:MAG: polyphosphate kinase 1 [Candidatus Brocadiia bacterium]